MKLSIENGKISYQTTMEERLERIGEVGLLMRKIAFRLDFIEKIERRFRSTTQIWEQYSGKGRILYLYTLRCQRNFPPLINFFEFF